jgi:hypothetical protein
MDPAVVTGFKSANEPLPRSKAHERSRRTRAGRPQWPPREANRIDAGEHWRAAAA